LVELAYGLDTSILEWELDGYGYLSTTVRKP